MLGESADDFVAIKLEWLLRHIPALRAKDRSLRILDYGCGTATLLRLMAEAGLTASLAGCDLSAGMLEEAQLCWPGHLPMPKLQLQNGAVTPFPAGSVDVAVISAVLPQPRRSPFRPAMGGGKTR